MISICDSIRIKDDESLNRVQGFYVKDEQTIEQIEAHATSDVFNISMVYSIIYDKMVENGYKKRYRYVPVKTFEEATHVSFTGVAGGMAKIENVEVVGEIGWSQEKIKEAQDKWLSDFDNDNIATSDWVFRG